ncbi:Alpha/Beta hydrolase protein [Xylariales sp. PMI_506]|nr:Alpha/Beta hydrolase protein [Xylariales sp. PMI_506]
MYEKPHLTTWERLTLSWAITRTVAMIPIVTLGAFFRGSNGAPTYKQHIIYKFIKIFTSNTTTRHRQATGNFTSEAYKLVTQQRGFKPDIVPLGDALGCWLGQRDADVVILYLHGGAYTAPAMKGHFQFLYNLIDQAKSEGKSMSAFFPQYDLAPHATYPKQLEQASAAYTHLTKDLNISPSQIILAGDSAGANLALALLSHMMHPHPNLPPLDATGPSTLRGVLLISPWVTFLQTAASVDRNAHKDYLSPWRAKQSSEAFLGSNAEDNYTTPLAAPPEWWSNLPADRVFLLVGSDELIIDDVTALGQNLQKYNTSKFEFFVGEGECHVSPVVEIIIGLPPGLQANKIKQWFSERI